MGHCRPYGEQNITYRKHDKEIGTIAPNNFKAVGLPLP